MKRIRRDGPMPSVVSTQERELFLNHTLIGGKSRTRLATGVESAAAKTTIQLTPEELNELLEWIVSAANHAEERSLESRLDRLYGKLERLEDSLDVYEE